MITPNIDQLTSLLRTSLKIVGVILVARGTMGITDAVWQEYSGYALVLLPIIWDLFVHSDTGKLKAVEAMPDVKAIVAVQTPSPTGAVADAADDITRPKVVETPPKARS